MRKRRRRIPQPPRPVQEGCGAAASRSPGGPWWSGPSSTAMGAVLGQRPKGSPAVRSFAGQRLESCSHGKPPRVRLGRTHPLPLVIATQVPAAVAKSHLLPVIFCPRPISRLCPSPSPTSFPTPRRGNSGGAVRGARFGHCGDCRTTLPPLPLCLPLLVSMSSSRAPQTRSEAEDGSPRGPSGPPTPAGPPRSEWGGSSPRRGAHSCCPCRAVQHSLRERLFRKQ